MSYGSKLLIFDDQRARFLKTEDCVCLKDATILGQYRQDVSDSIAKLPCAISSGHSTVPFVNRSPPHTGQTFKLGDGSSILQIALLTERSFESCVPSERLS